VDIKLVYCSGYAILQMWLKLKIKKSNEVLIMKCHSGSSDRATFFKGGSLSASSFKAVLFSVCLRLVPDTLGSGERDIDFLISDFSNDEVGCFACGGVDRPSGVPDRLRCAASVRKRAARLLGEITASA
jgi:hypothetical protein